MPKAAAPPPHAAPPTHPAGGGWAAQVVVLGGGLVLTLAVCAALALFLDMALKAEASAARAGALDALMDALDDAQETVQAGAQALYLGGAAQATARGERGAAILARAVAPAVPGLERFDHLVWVHEARPGVWATTDVYVRPPRAGEAGATLKWSPGPGFARFARVQGLAERSGSRAFGAFPGLPEGAADDKPFIIAQAVRPGDGAAGALVGLTRIGTLRPGARGAGVTVVLESEEGPGQAAPLYARPGQEKATTYTFAAMGREWSVAIAPDVGAAARLLHHLPFYAGAAGFFLTLLVSAMVRMHAGHLRRAAEVNRRLERKNFELEAEVAERERVGSRLRRTEGENRAIIDSVGDPIFEINDACEILFLSAAWRALTGLDPEESVGGTLCGHLAEADQDALRAALSALFEHTGPERATRRVPAALKTAGGTHRAVEIALSAIARRDGPPRIVGTITDVEERRRTEAALQETESKYRAIVENAAGGIYQITPEGIYLSANPALARILGYASPEDLLRHVKNAHKTVYADPAARVAFLRALDAKGQAHDPGVEVTRKDGARVWVSESARAVRDPDSGAILYYEGSMEDVTARREAERALRDAKMQSDMASRSKSEFLANMSHELRTPLNAIIGFADIIKNEVFGALGKPEYKEYATDIHENGQRLLAIINEILDISRIEAGERQLSETAVDLAAVIAGALEGVAAKADLRGVVLDPAPTGPLEVVGEERALKQVVANLLSNAVKFTPEGGRVTVAARQDARGLTVSITDTGIGMDADEVKKALSPFGQVDMELDRAGSGTGLGLSLVQALMKLHGGEFDIVSQKGIGTTVTLAFPADRLPR